MVAPAGLSDGLRDLLEAAEASEALRHKLGSANSLTELVEVARAAGHGISPRELQLWAHHAAFQASWWPWAGLGARQRSLFFQRG